jgi:hypothetical protein
MLRYFDIYRATQEGRPHHVLAFRASRWAIIENDEFSETSIITLLMIIFGEP